MELKKELKFIDIFSITTGAMISSGIFILPGLAFAQTGPSVFLSYFLAGVLALTGAFSIAELSSAMPRAGGDYFFITRSMGPLLGTISGLMSWLALSLKTSFAIIGISEILYIVFHFPIFISSILLCIFFIVMNIIGIKHAGRFEVVIVLFLFAIMIFYLIVGLPKINIINFQNFAPRGVNAIFLTAGFVFVSYGGLLKTASIAEEVKDPKKNIVFCLFVSLFVVTILYSLVTLITVGTVEAEQLKGSLTPIADSAENILGLPGKIALTLAALLAFISTGNAGIMSASRYPLALSRDKLLPEFINTISRKFQTPIHALVLTGILITVSFFLQLDILVKAASTVVILTYIFAQLSIIILRESGIQNYQPSFKAPFYPWIQILSIIAFILLIIEMGLDVIFICLGLVIFGILFYIFYGRFRNQSEYALLHLVEKVTNKKILSDNLNKELKKIISERDEIKFDRFDRLVEQAHILDLEGPYALDAFFEIVSETLAKRITGSKEEIYDLLKKRETETSTAITPFLAIPHIIIEGENLFELVIVRCKNGIYFSETNHSIKSVFVLAGTMDQRNFHLQALSAIAQIVLKKDFRKNWLKAKNINNLKDIIHLSDRQRFHI